MLSSLERYAAHLGPGEHIRFGTEGARRPVGGPPVLVVGSPDDRVVPRAALDRAAARFGGAPLLFPGVGHAVMVQPDRADPIDAILDRLTKEPAA